MRYEGRMFRLVGLPILAATWLVMGQTVEAQAPATFADNSGVTASSTEPTADQPTFYSDVMPILQENCVSCHREEGRDDGMAVGFHLAGLLAPMSLETYESARPWAPMIAHEVSTRRMPPFAAHVQHEGTYKNERYLTDEEIETIVTWAETGAPAGDPAQAPRAEDFTEAPGSVLGEPDLIVRMQEPWCLADDVVDMYVNLELPVPLDDHPQDRWIKASQHLPGSDIVHHTNSPYLGVVAPGRGINEYPEGFGVVLPAGEVLSLDMHYHKFDTSPGSGVCDTPGGAFRFYEEGEVIKHNVRRTPGFGTGPEIMIPANEPNYTITRTQTFEEDTYLLSTSPHMHLRGKSAKLEMEYPDGTMETLLWIPNYDFRWQHKYDFAEPVFMPAGTTLYLTGVWDNSASNPNNPDPNRDVPYGLGTTDEMLTGGLFFANAEPINHVVGQPVPEEYYFEESRLERLEHGQISHLVTIDDLDEVEREAVQDNP